MTTNHKQVLLQLLATSKFNLSPQEMQVVLEAINALALEVQAETEAAKKETPEKGGDPVPSRATRK